MGTAQGRRAIQSVLSTYVYSDLRGGQNYAKHMKLFWAKRAAVGHGMKIMRTSPKMKINQPTTRVFNLPANLIFWGLPVLPPLPTPYFPFHFETLRQRIELHFR